MPEGSEPPVLPLELPSPIATKQTRYHSEINQLISFLQQTVLLTTGIGLRYFPPHLVRDHLQRFGISADHRVLDPFCGTGTTVVGCKNLGIPSVGVEANPMAQFAGQVKVDWSVDPDRLSSILVGWRVIWQTYGKFSVPVPSLPRDLRINKVPSARFRLRSTFSHRGLSEAETQTTGTLFSCKSPMWLAIKPPSCES